MTRYRVAIVGTGSIANYHIQALADMGERVEVVAAVDVLRDRVEAYSAKHAIPHFYTDATGRTVQQGSIVEGDPFYYHVAGQTSHGAEGR